MKPLFCLSLNDKSKGGQCFINLLAKNCLLAKYLMLKWSLSDLKKSKSGPCCTFFFHMQQLVDFHLQLKDFLYHTWQQWWVRQRSQEGKSILFLQNTEWLTISPLAGYTNPSLCSLFYIGLRFISFLPADFIFLSLLFLLLCPSLTELPALPSSI